MILELLTGNPNMTRQDLADEIGVSLTTVRTYIASLREENRLEYIGSARKGSWIVK